MNKRYRIIVAVILALGSIIAISKSSDKDCINVYVDYNNLEMSTFDKCLPVTSDIKAIDLLKNNNFTLQGTQKYGDAVVCRLNGLPTAKDESCQDMPSDKAYWAILEKKKQLINIPFMGNGYSWAQVGISELILSPGDSLALVFAKDGEVKFPE